MKIVCESCGAKYSIADERITGKVFKIRCKRCSEVIIVRGDQPVPTSGGQPAQQPAAAQDAAGIWHIVVEGEQAGPYTPAQLGEMLSAGTVDWEAYVWTEGFDNWLPLRDVPDLVAQITGESAQPAAAQPAAESRAATYRSAVQETLTGQPSMGADPFADDAPSDGGLFGGGAAASGGGGHDLFARGQVQASASPYAGGPDSGMMTSALSPRVEAAQAMTGARNENSVLFSLKNLQALATGGSGSAAASMPAAASLGGGGRNDGYASGEGSGLIDIRALATATGVSDSGEGGGARDELLSIGAQGFGTLGSPMMASASGDDEGNKKVLVWAGVAAVGFISAAAVAIIYLTRAPAASGESVGVSPAAAAAPVAPAPVAPLPAAPAPTEGELAARAAADTKAGAEPERSGSDRGSSRHHSSRSSDSTATTEPKAASEPMAAAKPAPSKPGGPRSIDDLLDGALGGGSSAKPKPAAGGGAANSNLAETPTREQVKDAMNAVKPAVSACSQGQGGLAMVTVSVAGETGRVTNATVSGVTGPAGSCVAQAVRKAQFPKFQNKVFKVQFPFKL